MESRATPIHEFQHRGVLLHRRAHLEHALGTARTVGDVWRITSQIDAVDQRLTDGAAPVELKPRSKSRSTPLDDDTLRALRIAVGLIPRNMP